MQRLLFVVLEAPANGVEQEADQEQKEEGDRERILVEHEHPASATDRPGRIALVAHSPRIAIDLFAFVRVLRFGGALLKEKNREENKDPHLEKFRFPVLHCRFGKMGT